METTNPNELKEINLRLRQLVALKVTESIREGFYPHEVDYSIDEEEQYAREDIVEDEEKEFYAQEFRDATRELEKIRRTNEN